MFTIVGLELHAADPFAHGHKGVVVLLQTLISLLVQSREGPELGPVKALAGCVVDHAEGGDHTVKVCFLTPGPPDHHRTSRGRERGQVSFQIFLKVICNY